MRLRPHPVLDLSGSVSDSRYQMPIRPHAAILSSLKWLFPMSLTAAALSACTAVSPPLSSPQIARFSARLANELLATTQPSPSGPMNVEDAVARAVRHNHSIRAKQLEAVLAEAKVQSLAGAMLPKLVAESDYYGRDRPQASHSSHVSTYSTSSDMSAISRDITLSWNILDLGLAYLRATQGLAKAHQLQEEQRRIRGRVAEETRLAFWRAVALDRLEPGLAKLEGEVAAALKLAKDAGRDSQIDPLLAITLQRDILNLQREINQIHVSISGAHAQLKQLTDMQGVEDLRLDPSRRASLLDDPPTTMDAELSIALRQRPEIRQHMYDMRITMDEIEATILQTLPGVTLSRSFMSDSNSYLLNAHWISWGTKIAGNLMNLARLDADLETIHRQGQVQRQSAVATAAAIVMQVYVARARLAVEKRSHRDAERFATVQQQLLRQARASLQSGKSGQQALTREKLATLLAEVRALVAFADLQAAKASSATARGDDPDLWQTQTAHHGASATAQVLSVEVDR